MTKQCDLRHSTYILPILTLIYLSLVVFLGCEEKLYGLDNQLTPLAQVQLKVKKSEIDSLPIEVRSRLHFGLVWLDINIPSTWCAEQLSALVSDLSENTESPNNEALPNLNISQVTQLSRLCRDPFGVSPLLVGPSLAFEKAQLIQEGGQEWMTGSLSFTALPPSEVLIGTPDARVGYASLVIFEDLNNNGVLDLGRGFPPLLWTPQRGPGSDEDEQPDEGARRRYGEEQEPDRLYSSSFTSLLTNQTRLVFREGKFTPSYFYPLGGCIPPKGFSVVEVKGNFQEAHCITSSINEATQLQVTTPSLSLQETICEPSDVWTFKPNDMPPDPQYEYECISPLEMAAYDPNTNCKQLSIIKVLDCPSAEPNCEQPAWDERNSLPDWWFCEEQSDFEMED